MVENRTLREKYPLRILVLVLLLAGAGIFFYFQTGEKLLGAKAPAREQAGSASSLMIKNILFTRTEGTRLALKVSADSAEYRENPRVATLENIRARIYPKAGGEIRLFSDSGQYDLEREILSLPGAVTAVTRDGLQIGAGQGTYDNRQKELLFESFLTVTGSSLFARGNLLKVNTLSGKLTIENGITADLTPARIRDLLKIQNPGGSPADPAG